MKHIYPDLWQTNPEHPVPEAPEGTCHAYLLVRNAANILFYNTGREAIGPVADAEDLRHIQELGGITHQLLAHYHEAVPGYHEAVPALARIKQMFGSMLSCHQQDAEATRKAGGIPVDVVFQARERFLDNIEVIPTPGHTPGSTCFQYKSPHGKTYLFTGDTIVPGKDGWVSFAFADGSKEQLKSSLELLRGLEPDVVIAAGAVGPETCKEVSPTEWKAAVDQAMSGLS